MRKVDRAVIDEAVKARKTCNHYDDVPVSDVTCGACIFIDACRAVEARREAPPEREARWQAVVKAVNKLATKAEANVPRTMGVTRVRVDVIELRDEVKVAMEAMATGSLEALEKALGIES